MESNNEMMARQLRALADAMSTMAEEDLLPTILDVCDGLLAQVEQRRKPVSQLHGMELAQLMGGYQNLSAHVGRFAGELEQPLALEQTRQQLTDHMQALESHKQESAALTQALQELQAEAQQQRQRNQALEESVAQAQSALDTLRNFHASLVSMGQSCSPEVIEASKQENAALMEQINDRQQELKALQAQQQELDENLAELHQKIAGVQQTMDALPAEHARLLETYDEMQSRLARLRMARETCSPENQQALQEEIAALEPEVEAQKENMDQLENHYARLSGAKTELDRQNQRLQTNVLDLLVGSMEELNQLLSEHRETLEAIAGQAQTYQESLDVCRNLRSGYADWCGADRVQLDAMLLALDQRENLELSRTLDFRQQDKIRSLFDRVDESLKELDRILGACALAARKDQAEIERKAGSR